MSLSEQNRATLLRVKSRVFHWLHAPSEEEAETELNTLLDAARAEGVAPSSAMVKMPTQIGHLYRGDEAAEVIREVARQNPEAEGVAALQQAAATSCFECGHDLNGPYCPACNPALQQAGEPVAWAPHHHKRHPWAQPGDEPNRIWIMRFADPDMREMVWTDENAEADAKAAYEKYSPAWNVYLFATVPTSPLPQQTALVEEKAEIAAFLVEQHDEPDPFGDMGKRGQYWRDKCITAGQRLDPKRWVR